MKHDRRRADDEFGEFDELIEVYKDYVEKDVNRRTRRALVFWSFIPILYLHGDLRLNIATTTTNSGETAKFWGIPVDGITEDKFLCFLFIMILYFIVKFVFYVVKIIPMMKTKKDTNICKIFVHFLSLKDRTGNGSRKELREKFRENISVHESNTPFDSKFESRYHTWLFVHRYYIIGFIDYLFSPIIFPALLGLWAFAILVVRILC